MIKMLYEPFQKWSEKGSIYIISDPHFDDADCRLMDPDWPSPQEYIDNINKVVYKNDTLICLGDIGDPRYLSYLKSRYKILIKGNHDAGNENYKLHFDEIYEGPVMIAPKIMLSHEPILSDYWINIHGHVHNQNESLQKRNEINLAANTCGYGVFNLGAAIKNGLVSQIDNIHRVTIDQAVMRKEKNDC